MIDFHTLPFASKIILAAGVSICLMSFALQFRYSIILILMKYNPEYRKFMKKTLEHEKLKKSSYHGKNNIRNR
jgi:hypothetical protein